MAFLAVFLLDICTSHHSVSRGLICCTDPTISAIEETSPDKPSLIVHSGCEPLTDCAESTICPPPGPSFHSSTEFCKTARPMVMMMDHPNTVTNYSRFCTLCSTRTSTEWPVLSPTKVIKQVNQTASTTFFVISILLYPSKVRLANAALYGFVVTK